MRFLCVHCDERFEADSDKPRCPKCLRQHGIEKMKEPAQKAGAKRPPWIVPVVVLAVAAAVGGAYAFWAKDQPAVVDDEVPLRPLEQSEVRGHLRRLHASASSIGDLLVANEAIETLGTTATRGKASAEDKAEAVVAAIRARASKRAFVTWSLSAPRETLIRDARATLEHISHDGAEEKLYPLEVAAVAVSALRSVGVEAMLAEVYAFEGDRTPPDPSGYFGYFVVAVYPGEVGQGEPHFYDPFAGHGTAPEDDQVRVVNDVQAIGAAVNHLAVHKLIVEANAEQAFAHSQNALKLDPDSPSVRGVMGAVALLSGGVDEGVAQYRAAAQLRRDAPRLNLLAGLALARGEIEEASANVNEALELSPDFPQARATLAAIHLAGGRNDEAHAELQRVEQLDPSLPNLPMLWANYYLATGEVDQASAKAHEAIEREPHDWQSRLAAARIFRAAGDFDAMRAEAHWVMEHASESQRDHTRQIIEQVLGPTALEEDLGDDEDLGEEALEEEGGDDYQLGQGLRLGEGMGGGLDLGGGGGAQLRDPGEALTPRLGGGNDDGLQLNLGGE